jgi:hypothetical protein
MKTHASHDDAHPNFSGTRSISKIKFRLSVHRYLPIAAFYFFLNSVGLPRGLFFTTVFAPLLFLWLYLKGRHWLTAKFLLMLSPFILVQISMGIGSYVYYLRSLLLLWTVFIAVYAFCWGLLKTRNIDRLFDELIELNFSLTLLALACRFTSLRDLFWMDTSDTLATSSHLLRLSMFTSEPSVYAELMLPLIVFAALRLLVNNEKRYFLYFAMISLPFLLTQSFGGLSISFAAIGFTLMTSYRRLLKRPRSLILIGSLSLAVAALMLTQNPISARIFQVVSGSDSSTQSRTTLSFVAAYAVASSKSIWWGVGLGQGKITDVSDLGIGFTVGIIPNAIAGTFAELGIIGVLARLAAEFFLFYKTKVYQNSFRLAMFVAAFLVQFTGSHLMDVQQYLMWSFAFLPFFPHLNLRPSEREPGDVPDAEGRMHAV